MATQYGYWREVGMRAMDTVIDAAIDFYSKNPRGKLTTDQLLARAGL